MLNPVKSLFFQYYWWQSRHGRKSDPFIDALGMFTMCIILYTLEIVTLFDCIIIHFSFYLRVIEAIIIIFLFYLLYTLLYKREYKKILKDRRYHTRGQRIMALLFAVGSLLSYICYGIFLLLLAGGTIKLDLPLIK